jgi:hypothetical protein
VDQSAAATYYVLYRLSELGFAASPTTGGQADLMACTVDGRRVVLVRVRARERGSRFVMTAADRRPAGRNVAYVFVDLESGTEPSVFVLRGAHVTSLLEIDPDWPRDATSRSPRRGTRAFSSLDDYRDAWHLLGLSGASSSARSSSAVSSSPVL